MIGIVGLVAWLGGPVATTPQPAPAASADTLVVVRDLPYVPAALHTVRGGEHGDLRLDPGAREATLRFLRRHLSDLPALYLDHITLVVDSATYRAFLASPLLTGELSAFAVRTNRSGDRSWTGIGMSGERTYIEIYPAGSGFGGPGSSALYFSVEEAGGVEALRRAVARIPGATASVADRTGRMRGEEIGWFRSLRVAHDDPPVPPGVPRAVLEYHADFIARLVPDSADRVHRTDLRRRLRVNRYDPTRLMEDITGVVVVTDSVDAGRMARELAAFGQPVTRSGRGELHADGIGLTIRDGAARPHIAEIRIRLARPPSDRSTVRLGPGATLRFPDDTTAVLRLNGGPAAP